MVIWYSNLQPLQVFQSICLKKITGGPWYMTNNALHEDLKLPLLINYMNSFTNYSFINY